MPNSPTPDSFEVADYLGVLRRRGWITFALACIGALAAAAYLTVAPKTYVAKASVYVTLNAANENIVAGSKTAGSSVNMDNEAQIVQSNTVADLAAVALGGHLAPAQLIRQITVTVPANTSILTIGCAAPSADGAAACSQAFAQAYLASRHATAAGKIGSQLRQEQAKATKIEARTLSLHNKIRSLPPNSPALARAKLDLRNADAQFAVLRGEVSGLGAKTNTSAGYVITPAVPPARPSSPTPSLYVLSGLLAGLLIGLVAAFALDRRDNRVHAARDVERFLNLPVLFSLPQKKLGAQTAIVPAQSRTGRAYTELAHAVAASLGDGKHVVVVAGTSAGPATSVVAANLAATLARTRSEVILVCADLRDTMTATLLGVADGRGLAEILLGTATVSEVARQPAELSRLRMITPGEGTIAALSHIQHDASRRLVAGLQRDARYVIIAAQATGEGADMFSLTEFADAAIVVLELERTQQGEASDSVRRLDRMHTAVLGAAVLPRIQRPRGGRPRAAAPPQVLERAEPGQEQGSGQSIEQQQQQPPPEPAQPSQLPTARWRLAAAKPPSSTPTTPRPPQGP